MNINNVLSEISQIIKDEQIIAEITSKIESTSLDEINERVEAFSDLHQSKRIITNYNKFIRLERNAENASEKLLIEAIVNLYGRPALLIQNGTFEIPLSNVLANRLNQNAQVINKTIKSVGRIEISNHPSCNWIGTGWLVGDGIIATNRHVAEVFSYALPTNKIYFKTNNESMAVYKTSIDFNKEHNSSDTVEFDIIKVLYLAKQNQPDLALLEIKKNNLSQDELPKSIELDINIQTKINQDIAVIGYPAFDTRNTSTFYMNRIFMNIYGVKRLQPGKLVEIQNENCILHDCSTLGGNSGSPVIDIQSGKVIGIHYAGDYLKTNYAVPAKHIDEILKKL